MLEISQSTQIIVDWTERDMFQFVSSYGKSDPEDPKPDVLQVWPIIQVVIH